MKKAKTKKSNLFSTIDEVENILNMLKSKEKLYNKIIECLNTLGVFDSSIEVEVYEIKNIKDEYYIKLCCSDLNNNIFIFYAISLDKKDLNNITMITNNDEIKYDISLSKKFMLNKDNIDFIRSDKVYNFKYGRLITDEKNFYSIYLGNNIGYQLLVHFKDGNYISGGTILKELNSMNSIPTFTDFTKIFENLFVKEDIDFDEINLKAYKDFNIICNLKFHCNESKVKKLQKN